MKSKPVLPLVPNPFLLPEIITDFGNLGAKHKKKKKKKNSTCTSTPCGVEVARRYIRLELGHFGK